MKKKGKAKQILDNYTFKELDTTLKGFKSLESIYGFAKKFGYNNPDLDETFKKMEEEVEKYEKMKEVLYKFNEYFSGRGWIAFESLSTKLMEKCVGLADEGKLDEAEEELINYYFDRERIDFLIRRLIYFKDFQPRKDLFQKALDDHFNERFHSSVPIFLMMIDGFVSDIEQYGFFTDKVELNVWDTIVGHDSNLGEIHRILNKGRRKTVEDEIALPYRNGILHGRDLGYANLKVSAKSLGILFSLRDWADAIREGKRQEEKEYTIPTFKESFEQIKQSLQQYEENKKEREYMSNVWKPREITIGTDLPANGDVERYGADTPERKVVEFLSFLTKNNYGKLATCITQLTKGEESIGKLAGELREVFQKKQLISFELIEVKDIGAALTEVEVNLEFKTESDRIINDRRTFRLLYQDNQNNTLIRGYHDGEWKILFNFYDIEYLGY